MKTEAVLLPYEPALDGLRAISVLVVLGFHAGIPLLRGGFLGVDVFFVLSGFLITSLLVQEFDQAGDLSLRNFYMRRVLRLAPALLLVLGVFVVISYLLCPASLARHNAVEALIALLNGSNWVRAFASFPMDYLGHTWSLSIEEQFYLLWPGLLLCLLKCAPERRKLVALVLVLVFISWAWRVILWLQATSIARIYNGLDTHADGLMLGAALGVARSSGLLDKVPFSRKNAWFSFVAPFCLTGLLVFFVAADWQASFMYFGGLGIVNLLVVTLVASLFFAPSCSVARILRATAIVWIGRISYGLYLWHYPVYRAIQDAGYGHEVLLALGPPLSLLLASLSFYCLERPILRYKRQFSSLT